jgi:aspartyl protease family protein
MRISYLNGRRVQLSTANGMTSGYAVMLNAVTVGRLTLQQVGAVVHESETPVLIGASFLSRVNMTTDGKRMTLTKR